jgi:hypothetical protein
MRARSKLEKRHSAAFFDSSYQSPFALYAAVSSSFQRHRPVSADGKRAEPAVLMVGAASGA